MEEIAAAVGPDLETIFRFDSLTGGWDSYSPEALIPELNTLALVNQRDVLFLLVEEGSTASLSWPDLLYAEPVSVDLLPGFTFVGFTGADGTELAELLSELPPEVQTVFRFEPLDQQYGGFLRGQPPIISDFTTANRLDALLIVNDGPATSLEWLQVGRPRLPAVLFAVQDGIAVRDTGQFFFPTLFRWTEAIAVGDGARFITSALLSLVESVAIGDATPLGLEAMAQQLAYVSRDGTATFAVPNRAPQSVAAAEPGSGVRDAIPAAAIAAAIGAAALVVAIGQIRRREARPTDRKSGGRRDRRDG